MTKHTHSTRGNSRGGISFSRRPRALGQRRSDQGTNNAFGETFETVEVPLPEDEGLRLYLSRYMAAVASENLVDLLIRRAQGESFDFDSELTAAAVPAVIHEAMNSEALTLRLDIRSWRWMEKELRQIVASYREYHESELGAKDAVPAVQADQNERASP